MADIVANYEEIAVHLQKPSSGNSPRPLNKYHLRVLFTILLIEAFAFGVCISLLDSLYSFTVLNYIHGLSYAIILYTLLGYILCGLVYLDVEVVSGCLFSYVFVMRAFSVLPVLLYVLLLGIVTAESVFTEQINWTYRTTTLFLSQGGICATNVVLCSVTKQFLSWKYEEVDIPSFDSSTVVAMYI